MIIAKKNLKYYIIGDIVMKNIDNIRLSICNIINSLSEEDLRQLMIMCEGFRESEGLLSIRAIWGCGKCSEIFGDCDDYGSDAPCEERFRDYCEMEIPESGNENS